MSANKHTRGPWVYERDAGAPRPCITTVAVCCDFVIGLPSHNPGGNYRDGDPSGDPEADARLIAAAPDLFHIVERLAGLHDGLRNGNSGAEEAAVRLAEDARAALAKAKGE